MSADAVTTRAAVKTVALVTHTHPEQTADALRETVEIATKHGARVIASAEERDKHGDAAGGCEEADQLPEKADLCVVLGGDGTILHALRSYAGTDVPVFAVNFGTVGFLAAVERDELAPGLERALAGDFEVVALPGLKVDIDTQRPVALNDISFIRPPRTPPPSEATRPCRSRTTKTAQTGRPGSASTAVPAAKAREITVRMARGGRRSAPESRNAAPSNCASCGPNMLTADRSGEPVAR